MEPTNKQKHLLKLIQLATKDKEWAKVSSVVWSLLQDMPKELVELKEDGDAGWAKLTHEGKTVLAWT